MPHDGQAMPDTPILPDLPALTAAALPEVEALFTAARDRLKDKVTRDGRLSAPALEARQFQAHALAWLATYVEALRQLRAWSSRLTEAGQFGPMERLILQIGFGEYLNQIAGGLPMSQGEIARLSDLGQTWPPGPAAARLMALGNTPDARDALVSLMQDNHGRATFGATGLDAELEMIRDQFRRYADEKIIPRAQGWHLKDALIPMEVITDLAGMGVFGLTIPEEYGGFGPSARPAAAPRLNALSSNAVTSWNGSDCQSQSPSGPTRSTASKCGSKATTSSPRSTTRSSIPGGIGAFAMAA